MWELPQWLSSKEFTCSAGDAGDTGSIPGSGKSPGRGNGNPLQYACQESSMDRGAWWAVVHGVAKSWTWLSDWTCMCYIYIQCVYEYKPALILLGPSHCTPQWVSFTATKAISYFFLNVFHAWFFLKCNKSGALNYNSSQKLMILPFSLETTLSHQITICSYSFNSSSVRMSAGCVRNDI